MNFFQKLYQAQKLALLKIFFFLPQALRLLNARILSIILCVFEFFTFFSVLISLLFTLVLRSGLADDYLTNITKQNLAKLTPEMMGGIWFEVGEISFDDSITIKNFKLNDDLGTWLEVGELSIDFPSLQVLMFFSSIDINSITGSNISQYRNPSMRPSEKPKQSTPWTVPSIVMPQFLGKINIDVIDLDNVFVSKEVMYLNSFDVDLYADVSMRAEISHMKAEFTEVIVREEQTNVTGTIIYTPATFTCDLVAHDSRWGRVFPLINDAKLHAKIELVAKQLPPNPDFPLTVKLDSDVILSDFFWLKNDVVIDSKVSTFFSFDGTNVYFEDTNLYSELLDIEIPHFNLNLDNDTYDKTEAKVRVADLGVLFNGISGQSEGILTFSGEIFDMDAKVELLTKNFSLDYYSANYLDGIDEEFLKILRAQDLKTLVTANINLLGERLRLSGYVDAETQELSLLNNGKQTTFDFETAYVYDIKEFDFHDISLFLDEASLYSDSLVLDFENTIVEEDELYIPLMRGSAVIDANNLAFLDKALEMPIQSDAYVQLFAEKGQKMHLDAGLYNLDFGTSTLTELTLKTDVHNFNNFYYGKFPQLEGGLIARNIELAEFNENINMPNKLIDELALNFSDPLNKIDGDIEFELSAMGALGLNAKASINFLTSLLKIYHLEASVEHIKQTMLLTKPTVFDFSSSYTLTKTELELTQNAPKVQNAPKALLELDFIYANSFLDVYTKSQIPSSFVNAYLKNALFPEGLFKLDLDLTGEIYNPQGKLKFAFHNIDLIKNSAKLHLDIEGDIQNNSLAMQMKFGRKRKLEFEASALVPLALKTPDIFDYNRAFSLDFNWLGNIGTFFQLYPLLDMKIEGNAKIDLAVKGTLNSPTFNGFAYVSKGSLVSDEYAFYLSDIDLELITNEKNSSLKLKAKDGSNVFYALPKVDSQQKIIIKNSEKYPNFIEKEQEQKQISETASQQQSDAHTLYLNAFIQKLEEQYHVRGSTVMNSFSPYRPEGLNLVFSSSLNMNGTLPNPNLNGEIFINKASFDFSKLELSTQVDSLQNLQVVRNKDEIEKINLRALRKKAFAPRTNISLIIPDNAILYGMGLGSVWGGELNINTSSGELKINGDLTSSKGVFNFLSKNFNLTDSIISFSGDPTRPFYEVAFERSNQVIESIVKIKGFGTDLNIELSSNPTMPIDEIISYTLYGKELADLSQFQAIQVGTTTAQLLSPGLQQLNLLNTAKKTFGLDVLSLGSKDSLTKKEIEEENELDDATIEAGTYIGDRLYLGVERSLEDTAVKVEVELMPSVDVEARIGTDSSEAELRWKVNY